MPVGLFHGFLHPLSGLDHILERVKHQSVPVLLISAKDGADTFIREMRRDPRAVYRVVGVLADTPSRVGREIYRVPVLGTVDGPTSAVPFVYAVR